MNEYVKVDTTTWPRKMHCDIFRNYANPRYDISFNLDITNFYSKVKQHNWSFTLAMIHCVTHCVNQIEEFRYRFESGDIVLYNSLDVSFAYLNKETNLLKNIVTKIDTDIDSFIAHATQVIHDQNVYFTGPLGNDIYQFSNIPWISYTHISHTDSGKKDNAVPMFDWGKYFKQDNKLLLPFSIQAHHSFVDGIHMGQLAHLLQNYLNDLK